MVILLQYSFDFQQQNCTVLHTMALNVSTTITICQLKNFLKIESSHSIVEEVIWFLAGIISTGFNALTALRIFKKSAFQLFDICLINFSLTYLLQGNILFISMALFSSRAENCTLANIVVISFLMLSFTKLGILVVINASQIYNLRHIRIVNNAMDLQTQKRCKNAFFLALVWLFSIFLVLISWYLVFDLFPVIVISFFGSSALVLRVIVVIQLRGIGDSTSDTMKQTLAMVKKSMRVVSLFIFIEVCSWVPSIVVGLLHLFGPKTQENLHGMNWCLRVLFLIPMFYPFVSVVSHTSLANIIRQYCSCPSKIQNLQYDAEQENRHF